MGSVLYTQKCKISLYTTFLGIYFASVIFGTVEIGSFSSILKLIAIIPFSIWLITSHRIRIEMKVIPFFIYVLLCWASSFWSLNCQISIERAFTHTMFLLLLVSSASYRYSNEEISYLKKMLIWSSRISLIVTICFARYYEGRLRLIGIFTESPNYLCGYYFCGVVNCIECICDHVFNDKKISKIAVCWLELGLYLFVVIASGSRGGALAVLIAMLLGSFSVIEWRRIKTSAIFKTIVVFIGICLVIPIAVTYISPQTLDRYTMETIIESKGVGRYDIWTDTIRTFVDSNLFRQLFGYGAGMSFAVARTFSFTYINVSQNLLLETLIELGIVGLIAHVLHIYSFYKISRSANDKYSTPILIGFIALTMSISGSALKPYWNILLYILCVKCCQSNSYICCNEGDIN